MAARACNLPIPTVSGWHWRAASRLKNPIKSSPSISRSPATLVVSMKAKSGFSINLGPQRRRRLSLSAVANPTDEESTISDVSSSTTAEGQLLPAIITRMKGNVGLQIAAGVFLALTMVLIFVREIVARKRKRNQEGSVADLVRRGQLKSHKRTISTPLRYEDPFNNPMVKVNKSKSSVEMCGKVYGLVPLTLTAQQQSSHQRRRSRVYQWKRPTVFLKEGDPLPANVDPDTVRWIPANHPFATTVSDIDEDLARNNVHLQSGVPYRVRAEHEALQKKLEAQQADQRQNLAKEWSSSDNSELEEQE
ncbi:multiple chloroplast division site 1 [Wolffia australiana]